MIRTPLDQTEETERPRRGREGEKDKEMTWGKDELKGEGTMNSCGVDDCAVLLQAPLFLADVRIH